MRLAQAYAPVNVMDTTSSLLNSKEISKKPQANYGDVLFGKIQEENCYDSFKKLFELYYNQILFFAKKYVYTTENAEEIVNDVFLKMWNKRSDIQIKGSFQSYMYSSVRNKCIDALRKNSNVVYESDQSLHLLASNHSDTLEIIKCQELHEKIDQAIQSLPKDRRRIFELSRREGLMYKEIAEKLGISIKTVETQMGRSLRFLREMFQQELSEFYQT